MAIADFENVLKQAMGLDAASIGSKAVQRAVNACMSASGLKDADEYLQLIRSSASELQALIEAVVVSETWFFRDREAFAVMARIAHEEWLRAHAEGTLHLLSLPCSSGEEPYSMAMALLDEGFPATRYRVDAVDISERVLELAERAVYGKNSFRGNQLEFRDRYFDAMGHGYRLGDAVRQRVRFHRGNLLAADFQPGAEAYDVIFCRNLLIYFDRDTQDRAVRSLRLLLAEKGVLFVGPSEAGLLLNHGFVPVTAPQAFAFRMAGAVLRAAAPASVNPGRRPRNTPARPNAPLRPDALPEPAIAEASRLADAGRLVEAAKSCEEHLRRHGPSAEAFSLLGLIRAAAGNLKGADQYYRKALYLEPSHRDTLVHLALLLDKQGDSRGAQVMRNRLMRQTAGRIK